jgi:NMT1/THI5 like
MKFDWIRLLLAIAVNLAFMPAAVAQALEPLAMSYLPGNAIAWDLDVAMDKGFFKAEGFDGKPVVFQNAPQPAQMLITGEVQLGTGQIDPFLLAFRSGARDIAVIAAPADRPDWFINVRPEIKSVADLKGKLVATAALQVGESWLTANWINEHGLKPQDWSFRDRDHDREGRRAARHHHAAPGLHAAARARRPLPVTATLTDLVIGTVQTICSVMPHAEHQGVCVRLPAGQGIAQGRQLSLTARSRGRGNPAFASIKVRGFGKGWIPASAGMSGEFLARSFAGDDSSADQVLAAIQQP